jgi:hypothetical protein
MQAWLSTSSRSVSSEPMLRAQLSAISPPRSAKFEQLVVLGVGPYEAVRRGLPVAVRSVEIGDHGGGLATWLQRCFLGSAPTTRGWPRPPEVGHEARMAWCWGMTAPRSRGVGVSFGLSWLNCCCFATAVRLVWHWRLTGSWAWPLASGSLCLHQWLFDPVADGCRGGWFGGGRIPLFPWCRHFFGRLAGRSGSHPGGDAM